MCSQCVPISQYNWLADEADTKATDLIYFIIQLGDLLGVGWIRHVNGDKWNGYIRCAILSDCISASVTFLNGSCPAEHGGFFFFYTMDLHNVVSLDQKPCVAWGNESFVLQIWHFARHLIHSDRKRYLLLFMMQSLVLNVVTSLCQMWPWWRTTTHANPHFQCQTPAFPCHHSKRYFDSDASVSICVSILLPISFSPFSPSLSLSAHTLSTLPSLSTLIRAPLMLLMNADRDPVNYRPRGDCDNRGVIFSPQGSMVEAVIWELIGGGVQWSLRQNVFKTSSSAFVPSWPFRTSQVRPPYFCPRPSFFATGAKKSKSIWIMS